MECVNYPEYRHAYGFQGYTDEEIVAELNKIYPYKTISELEQAWQFEREIKDPPSR